jgi:tetratricopeptide (TPR) repeat protein
VLERLGRWCRRNPAIASLATTVVALLVAAVAILSVSNAQIRRESAAKVAAMKEREAALSDKNYAVGQVYMYRGLYGVDEGEAKTLGNFNEALKADPSNPDILWLRGFTLGGWGRWDEALADMTTARERLGNSELIDPASRDWFVAMLHVAKGDREAYRAACRAALAKMTSEPNLDQRGTLLWMCTVTPDAVDEPTQLNEFAAAVLPPDDKPPTSDRLLDAGAALFRAGRFPEAERRLRQAVQSIADGNPTSDPMSEALAHIFLAMNNAQLGMHEQAEANLATAERLAVGIKPPCWVSKLQYKMLSEEARTAVESDKPPRARTPRS